MLRPSSLVRTSLALAALAAPVALRAQEKDELQKCDKPIGTLAVVEPQEEHWRWFQQYQLGSPTPLIRMMIQKSKCFDVVERGIAMQNLKQERELAKAGEMQQDENIGAGQMKAAEFIMTPTLLINNPNSGGVGGVIGGRLGRGIGGLGGGVKFKEAETSLLIADTRTSVQVAAATGKAKKTNFSLGALGFMGAVVGVGAYSNTAEGKVIAASYLDNYNQLVTEMKANERLMKRAERYKGVGADGDEVKAGATYNEGDVLAPKIDNIKLLAEPKDGAKVAGTVKKTDDLVFLGEEKDGYVKVQGANAEGWVKKAMVSKR
jgi:hypothetical protein